MTKTLKGNDYIAFVQRTNIHVNAVKVIGNGVYECSYTEKHRSVDRHLDLDHGDEAVSEPTPKPQTPVEPFRYEPKPGGRIQEIENAAGQSSTSNDDIAAALERLHQTLKKRNADYHQRKNSERTSVAARSPHDVVTPARNHATSPSRG